MLPLALSAATPAIFISYSALSDYKKPPVGQLIIRDLAFTIFWCILSYTLTSAYSNPPDFLTWFGFTITVDNYGAMLSCCSVVFVIYIGPLVQTAFIEDEGEEFNLPELKSYVTDALCEEAFFRTCHINFLLASGFGFNGCVFVSMIIFTAVKCRNIFLGLNLQNAIKHGKIWELCREVFFNLVLGWMLGYMYVRTASYLACVVVHVFKNFMGFPDIGFYKPAHMLYSKKWIIGAAYCVGIAGFVFLFNLILMNPEVFEPWHARLAI